MKIRNMLIAIVAIILVAILPAACLAESGHSIHEARQYVFKFADERELGDKDALPIYSAPALNAIRGANGKATCYTSDGLDSAGWNGAWLLVRYVKNNGGYRVGWVPNTALRSGEIQATRGVNFAYWIVELVNTCMLTDDPLLESKILSYAYAGQKVTFLATYQYGNGREYAYVMTNVSGHPVCGFIPMNAISW